MQADMSPTWQELMSAGMIADWSMPFLRLLAQAQVFPNYCHSKVDNMCDVHRYAWSTLCCRIKWLCGKTKQRTV